MMMRHTPGLRQYPQQQTASRPLLAPAAAAAATSGLRAVSRCRSAAAGNAAATREAPQQQPQATGAAVSRRQAFLQLSGTAVLGPLAAALGGQAAAALLLPAQPAWAAGGAGPQELSGDVKAAVHSALDKFVVKAKGPVLLRLAYHDAAAFSSQDGSGGSNASIQFELGRPENTGLKRGWNVILQIASALEGTPAAGKVSKADLIALAGARAVSVCGGPSIPVSIGRTDATEADPPGRLVSEKAGVDALKANFAAKGLAVRELVALSGAHTLGGKGFGDPVTFDNTYYKSLQAKPWLNPNDDMASMIGLPSDHVLPDDPECRQFIDAYAADQALFFRDFAAAYQQLVTLGAAWA